MPYARRTSPAKVLVVDDDEGLSVLVAEALHEGGIETQAAASGEKAIACLGSQTFDLMLLDLGLKDLNGALLLRRLKEMKKELPFIVVTGQGDERVAVEMMKQGAIDYLIKDARMLDRLPVVVKRALEKLEGDRALTAARAALLESEQQLVAISERERESIGADLHDNLGQQLTAIELLCQSMRGDLKRQPKLEARMAQICRFLQESVAQTRLLARGLTPVSLNAEGLADSLAEMTRRMGMGKIQCEFNCPEPIATMDSVVANHLFRIAQEAVNNALKHSGARHVEVALTCPDGAVVLEIKDDGKGLPESRSSSGLGLEIMRHRANVIGARLRIESSAGKGVAITCTLGKNK